MAKKGEGTVPKPPRKKPPTAHLRPQWRPGVSGNPGGRPLGARARMSEKFLAEVQKYFELEGPALIARVGEEQPAILLQVIAKLLPRDVVFSVSGGVPQLAPEQRARIAECWLLGQSPDPAAPEGDSGSSAGALSQHEQQRAPVAADPLALR